MGKAKALLAWRGATLLEHQLSCLLEGGVSEVVVGQVLSAGRRVNRAGRSSTSVTGPVAARDRPTRASDAKSPRFFKRGPPCESGGL